MFLKSLELMDPWDHSNLVRIDVSPSLPRELLQIIEHCPKTESQTFGKHGFQHFCQQLIFPCGFIKNRLEQNVCIDRGIIS